MCTSLVPARSKEETQCSSAVVEPWGDPPCGFSAEGGVSQKTAALLRGAWLCALKIVESRSYHSLLGLRF